MWNIIMNKNSEKVIMKVVEELNRKLKKRKSRIRDLKDKMLRTGDLETK